LAGHFGDPDRCGEYCLLAYFAIERAWHLLSRQVVSIYKPSVAALTLNIGLTNLPGGHVGLGTPRARCAHRSVGQSMLL
jgi:hypothetical protein